MNTPLPCSATAVCSLHEELAQVVEELEALQNALLASADVAGLERFATLKATQTRLVRLIAIREQNDVKAATDGIDPVFDAEVKALLTKRAKSLDITNLDFTTFVKACVSFTSPQSYGSRVETRYLAEAGYQKVKAKDEQGDGYDPVRKEHFEFKFSVASAPENGINLVQIRPHHKLDSYHILVFLKESGTFEHYYLTKAQMAQELVATGSQLAHGTTTSKEEMSHPEFAIRFRLRSTTHLRWQQYRRPLVWEETRTR